MYMFLYVVYLFFFFFNDTATTEIYTLSLHDALPISPWPGLETVAEAPGRVDVLVGGLLLQRGPDPAYVHVYGARGPDAGDRKSTRLNSSHANISYAVFCLKKKKKQ